MLKHLKGARVMQDCTTGELFVDTGTGGPCKPMSGASSWNDLKDKPFYAETEIVELFPVQKFDNATLSEEITLTDQYIPVVEGKSYIVHYNGADYECTAKAAVFDGTSLLCLTDGDIIDFDGGNVNSKKFVIFLFPEDIAANVSGSILFPVIIEDGILAEYTVGIAEKVETVHKLDAKYMPTPIYLRSLWNSKREASDVFLMPGYVHEDKILELGKLLDYDTAAEICNQFHAGVKVFMGDGLVISATVYEEDCVDFYSSDSDPRCVSVFY